MSMYNRAAQFSPFAALTGYEKAIEEARKKQEKNARRKEPGMTALNDIFCMFINFQQARINYQTFSCNFIIKSVLKFAAQTYISKTKIMNLIAVKIAIHMSNLASSGM